MGGESERERARGTRCGDTPGAKPSLARIGVLTVFARSRPSQARSLGSLTSNLDDYLHLRSLILFHPWPSILTLNEYVREDSWILTPNANVLARPQCVAFSAFLIGSSRTPLALARRPPSTPPSVLGLSPSPRS